MEDDPLAGHPVLRSIKTLGRSGSHVVVLAQDFSTGQLVALKLIPRGFDSAQAKHLLREMLNHYELTLAKHPHIVSLLDCFLTPRYLAIVLEYVDGENLQVFLEKAGGCIIESLARFLFQQLVIALDFCHRRGKVNRNIRPSSLLLQLSDSALPLLRMVDFSASKDTLRNSEPRSQVGTAMYCAPEVLQNFNGAPYDALAADVWSVGVLLFVMLFGRHPFSRPEDVRLPAQQQVLAMFRRLTAPPGSMDGDLFVPHMLPTAALPGAQPGAPLSLAGMDLLRGMLARDPRVRLTLDVVQRHEWFQTNLPEGAALLNEVVAAEAEAAGTAAVMPAAVASQLERMVVLAAAGPANEPLAPTKVYGNGDGRGGGGGYGGPGEGSNGGLGPGGGGGLGPGGGGMRHVRDSSGGGTATYAPTTPQWATQGPQQQQRAPPQAPDTVITVTTPGPSDVVHPSTSVGANVSRQPQHAQQQQLLPVPSPLPICSGCDGAVAGGGTTVPTSSTGTAPAAAAGVVLQGTDWPRAARAGGSDGGAAAGSDGTGCDLQFPDLEAMVMGLPDDDLLEAAALDLFCPTPRFHGQTQMQPLPPLEQQQLQGALASNVSSGPDPAGPKSNDTVVSGFAMLPPPLPLPAQHQQHPHLAPMAGTGGMPLAATTAQQPDSGTVVSRTSDPWAGPAPPSGAAATLLPPNGVRPAAAAQLDWTPHHPAPATTSPHASDHPAQHPQMYMSLHTAAAAAATRECRGGGGGGGGGNLLMRLRTDSLPSPSTLAVVDAAPFLANGAGSGSITTGGARAGGSGGGSLFSGLFAGNGYLRSLRDNSIATIPSTYSMDWCSLSARSEALLSPKAAAAAGAANGCGSGCAAGGGASSTAPGAPATLAHSSIWHRICSEARELGRAVEELVRGP